MDPNIRHAYHHALLLALRTLIASHLAADAASNIGCYSQDPVYSSTDKAFFERYGICPVGDPEGFLEVDQSTTVISISPNVAVRGVVADIALPLLMVWDYVDF